MMQTSLQSSTIDKTDKASESLDALEQQEVKEVITSTQKELSAMALEIQETDLGDKEKLKNVQDHVLDMRSLLMDHVGHSPFQSEKYTVKIEENRGDASSYVHGVLTDKKTGETLYEYNFSANMLYEDDEDDYPINVVVSTPSGNLYYHGNTEPKPGDDHIKGLFNKYSLYKESKHYMTIIKSIIEK